MSPPTRRGRGTDTPDLDKTITATAITGKRTRRAVTPWERGEPIGLTDDGRLIADFRPWLRGAQWRRYEHIPRVAA